MEDGGAFCGGDSGFCPTTTSGPRMRVSEMLVGGKGGREMIDLSGYQAAFLAAAGGRPGGRGQRGAERAHIPPGGGRVIDRRPGRDGDAALRPRGGRAHRHRLHRAAGRGAARGDPARRGERPLRPRRGPGADERGRAGYLPTRPVPAGLHRFEALAFCREAERSALSLPNVLRVLDCSAALCSREARTVNSHGLDAAVFGELDRANAVRFDEAERRARPRRGVLQPPEASPNWTPPPSPGPLSRMAKNMTAAGCRP